MRQPDASVLAENRPTLLIVDDAPESIDVLRGVLGQDHRVKATIHSDRAVQIATRIQPDLILLDVMMPGMDGYEVCRLLKENPATRSIPVIFITTLSDSTSETHGLSLGAVDYVTKPFAPDLVKTRVKTHLALHHQKIALEQLVAERTAELVETRLEIIRRLSRAAEYRDNETGQHVVRMSRYSHLIALACGASEAESELILHAAPMHDIGKIGVPDRILLKAAALTEEEWVLMKAHTVNGAQIIGDHPSPLLAAARDVAMYHHERWDGSGYPSGLAGERIPRIGRIVALADVFDALTSARPYKLAWSPEDAMEYIRTQRGRHFEPSVVDALIQVLPQCLAVKAEYTDE